jgi:hypothetical protein
MCHSTRSAWEADLLEREDVGTERALRRQRQLREQLLVQLILS